MKYVYVVGRGHSGSTMFDAILGNSDSIESVGELVSGFSRHKVETCSCGSSMKDCDFWKKVVERYSDTDKVMSFEALANRIAAQAKISNFLKTALKFDHLQELSKSNELILNSIGIVANKPVVLESSKEPTRALMLARYSKSNYVIHLVRNPVAVISSTYSRLNQGHDVVFLRKRLKNKGVSKFLFITLITVSWSVGNVFAEIVKLFSRNRVLTVRYEDFIGNTAGQLDRIAEFLSVDLADVKQKLQNDEPFSFGHNVGGNKIRFKGDLRLQNKQKGYKMPVFYDIIVRVINFPFMIFYGYNPFKR